MIGETLTIENLQAIKKEMEKIQQIDQSEYFKNYYQEVCHRLEGKYKSLELIRKKELHETLRIEFFKK